MFHFSKKLNCRKRRDQEMTMWLKIIKKNKMLYNLLLKVHRNISFVHRYIRADDIVKRNYIPMGGFVASLQKWRKRFDDCDALNMLGWMRFNDFSCYDGKTNTGWNDLFLQPMVKNNFEEKRH